MAERSHSFTLKPGDKVNLVNGSAQAIRYKFVTECGAEIVEALHPGATAPTSTASPGAWSALDGGGANGRRRTRSSTS